MYIYLLAQVSKFKFIKFSYLIKSKQGHFRLISFVRFILTLFPEFAVKLTLLFVKIVVGPSSELTVPSHKIVLSFGSELNIQTLA